MSYRTRWLIVVVFALAMAWVESAVVFYLRTMIDRIEPHQPHPLPLIGGLGRAEVIREAATIVMLATMAALAGSRRRERFAWFVLAFGVWDLGYYAFLKVLTGWPGSLLDWDILFLIPLPWWGPVLAPALIALLMVIFGTAATSAEIRGEPVWPGRAAWLSAGAGALLALLTFMADSLRVASQGEVALRELLPERFGWGAVPHRAGPDGCPRRFCNARTDRSFRPGPAVRQFSPRRIRRHQAAITTTAPAEEEL